MVLMSAFLDWGCKHILHTISWPAIFMFISIFLSRLLWEFHSQTKKPKEGIGTGDTPG
jgi:hypothetical protein